MQEAVQLHREQKRQLVEAHVSLALQNKRLASARLPLVQQLQALQGRPWDSAACILSSSTQVCSQLLHALPPNPGCAGQLVHAWPGLHRSISSTWLSAVASA